MDPKNIAGRTSELARKLKDVAVAEQREMADELVTLLIEYWDLHPHSAMEMLQAVTLRLPLSLAHVQVATVVDAWKQKPNYAPTAGGNADHCYLEALILSENLDREDPQWYASVLPRYLQYGLTRDFAAMPDGEKRLNIVRTLADSIGHRGG